MATASKEGMRAIAEGTFTGYHIDPRIIEIDKGFNARNFDLPENVEHVQNLSDSIKAVGVQNPLVVRFTGGRPILVDGESRLRAVRKAIKDGADIKTIPVVQEGKHVSEEERVASLVTRNTGKQLTMLERGDVFARLKSFGWSDSEIAKKTGITAAHVSNIMALHTAPQQVKAMVAQGQVSSSQAVQVIREHGADAASVLKEVAKSSDNGKVTAKSMEHVKPTTRREKRNPLAFGRTDALSMFGALCDVYFTSGDRRAQGMCRNVFEDIIGSDWKTVAHAYHKEHNEGAK